MKLYNEKIITFYSTLSYGASVMLDDGSVWWVDEETYYPQQAIMCCNLPFPPGFDEEAIEVIKRGYAMGIEDSPFTDEFGNLERLPEDVEMHWEVDNYFLGANELFDHISSNISDLTLVDLRTMFYSLQQRIQPGIFGVLQKN